VVDYVTSFFINNSTNFEWELYFTDEENNNSESDQVSLLELSHSASPTLLETISEIVKISSFAKSYTSYM
jgi:hypothetical protein